MIDNFFRYYFVAGVLVAMVIRVKYGLKVKGNQPQAQGEDVRLFAVFQAIWGIAQILPFFYAFSTWLDFADYDLPAWLGWIGVVLFPLALWLLYRSHADLDLNFSPLLEIREGHALVTHGVFRTIRHPMYAAHILYAVAQVFLLHNWLVGWGGIISILPIYWLRIQPEEQMMLEQFGDQYREYMGRTGRLFPRFGAR